MAQFKVNNIPDEEPLEPLEPEALAVLVGATVAAAPLPLRTTEPVLSYNKSMRIGDI